jgi:hypothetical protein
MHAGNEASIFFRYMDQSDPAVQSKMLQALEVVKDAKYVDQNVSPKTNWLTDFQAFVAQSQPGNVTADGSVKQAAFYDQLDEFLTLLVRTCVCCMSMLFKSVDCEFKPHSNLV